MSEWDDVLRAVEGQDGHAGDFARWEREVRRSWLRRSEDWLLHAWDFPASTAVFAVLLPFLVLVFAVLASGGH